MKARHLDETKTSSLFWRVSSYRIKKFGLGRVKEFHNIGENSIVVVQFKSGQVKPLMLKYANLSVIE
jgi:hypothetical protein